MHHSLDGPAGSQDTLSSNPSVYAPANLLPFRWRGRTCKASYYRDKEIAISPMLEDTASGRLSAEYERGRAVVFTKLALWLHLLCSFADPLNCHPVIEVIHAGILPELLVEPSGHRMAGAKICCPVFRFTDPRQELALSVNIILILRGNIGLDVRLDYSLKTFWLWNLLQRKTAATAGAKEIKRQNMTTIPLPALRREVGQNFCRVAGTV